MDEDVRREGKVSLVYRVCVLCLLIVVIEDSCYDRLTEDVLCFRKKGTVVLLGDFNARFGRSVDVDDVYTGYM